MPRETALSAVHLDNMLALARMGVGICPPTPAFYNHPATIDNVVDHITVRMLDQLGLSVDYRKRWRGIDGQHGLNSRRGTTTSQPVGGISER